SAGGSRTAAACLCLDESEGPGPLGKRGRLLRGHGHARLRGDVASVALEIERVTRWTGFEMETAAAAGSGKEPAAVVKPWSLLKSTAGSTDGCLVRPVPDRLPQPF